MKLILMRNLSLVRLLIIIILTGPILSALDHQWKKIGTMTGFNAILDFALE